MISRRRTFDLAEHGLDGLARRETMTLYHGTTRTFSSFDMSKSRTKLVDQFYGAGIFLTPSKKVAWSYANANRNIGFDPEIINDLEGRNPHAGAFLRALYDYGREGWEAYFKANGFYRKHPRPGEGTMDSEAFERHLGGVDSNTLGDLAGYIIGSKTKPLGSDDDDPINIFDTSTGLPDYIYKSLDEIGLDSRIYRPKVYTVEVRVSKPLITASKAAAKKAKSKGYDAVIFYGEDLVSGVPEIAVFDPHRVKIKGAEVEEILSNPIPYAPPKRMVDPPRDRLWHLTTKKDFKIDPEFLPRLAYGLADHRMDTPALFLTNFPRYWIPYFGNGALWAVLVKPSPWLDRGNWEGGHPEYIDYDPAKAEVLEVLPVSEAVEKYPEEFGSREDWEFAWVDAGWDDKKGDYKRKRVRRKGFPPIKKNPIPTTGAHPMSLQAFLNKSVLNPTAEKELGRLILDHADAIRKHAESAGLPYVYPRSNLGCGSFGCVYRTQRKEIVFKITTDRDEAELAQELLRHGDAAPKGIVRYFGVVTLKQNGDKGVSGLWREALDEASIQDWPELPELDYYEGFSYTAKSQADLYASPRWWREVERSRKELRGKIRVASLEDAEDLGDGSFWLNGKLTHVSLWEPFGKDHSKNGAWIVGACWLLCEQAAKDLMRSNETREIGETLLWMLEKSDRLLADIEDRNVARVRRDGNLIAVIFDPGYSVRFGQDRAKQNPSRKKPPWSTGHEKDRREANFYCPGGSRDKAFARKALIAAGVPKSEMEYYPATAATTGHWFAMVTLAELIAVDNILTSGHPDHTAYYEALDMSLHWDYQLTFDKDLQRLVGKKNPAQATAEKIITSAATSRPQVPALFKALVEGGKIGMGSVVLDVGAGRYDLGKEYLEQNGIVSSPYDPYNRTEQENVLALNVAQSGRVDACMCANVLNVIAYPEHRAHVIWLCANAVRASKASAWFSIHEGDRTGVGRQTGADSWQENRKAVSYLKEIRVYFEDVQAKRLAGRTVIEASGPRTE